MEYQYSRPVVEPSAFINPYVYKQIKSPYCTKIKISAANVLMKIYHF